MHQTSKLHVDLDEVDSLEFDWLYVVLERPTGVVYHIQCGGLSCRQDAAEGILVPVHAPDSYALLQDLFVRDLCSAPIPASGLGEKELERLRTAVEAIRIPMDSRWPELSEPTDSRDIDWPQTYPIQVDETRLSEGYEAFLPVATPFGRGVLVWSNSD